MCVMGKGIKCSENSDVERLNILCQSPYPVLNVLFFKTHLFSLEPVKYSGNIGSLLS